MTEIRVMKLDEHGQPTGETVVIPVRNYAPQCAVHCAEAMAIGVESSCANECLYLHHPDNDV